MGKIRSLTVSVFRRIRSRTYTIVIRSYVLWRNTVVYDTVNDRLRPYTEFVAVDLGMVLASHRCLFPEEIDLMNTQTKNKKKNQKKKEVDENKRINEAKENKDEENFGENQSNEELISTGKIPEHQRKLTIND